MAQRFRLPRLNWKWPCDACVFHAERGFVIQWRGGIYSINGSRSEELFSRRENEVEPSDPLWLALIDELEDRSAKRTLTDQADILAEVQSLARNEQEVDNPVVITLDALPEESLASVVRPFPKCGCPWLATLTDSLSRYSRDRSPLICLVNNLIVGEVADWLNTIALTSKVAWAIHWPEALYLITPSEWSDDLMSACIAYAEANSEDLHHAMQSMRINSTDALVASPAEPPTEAQIHALRVLVSRNSSRHSTIWKILPSGSVQELWALGTINAARSQSRSSGLPSPHALLDRRFGILRSVHLFGTLATDSGDIFVWRTFFRQPRHKLGRNDGVDSPFDSFAADPDPEFARFKSMMEGIERYAGMEQPSGNWRKATRHELPDSALDMREIPGYIARQFLDPNFPYHRFCDNEPKIWLQGKDLASSENVWVLSDAIVWPSLDGRPCVQGTSSGTAAHSNYESACLAALYELVERDALMMAWLKRAACPRIDLDLVGAAAVHWLRGIDACGYRTHLLDITTDLGIPVVMSLAEAQAPSVPHLLVNGAAGWSIQKAAEKSVKELAMMVVYHSSLKERGSPVESVEACDQPSDHARLYYGAAARNHWEFLLANTSSRSRNSLMPNLGEDPVEALRVISAIVAQRGRVVAVDRTPTEALAAGLVVVSVVATGIQPIHFGKNTTRLRSRRLQDQPFPQEYLVPGAVDDLGLNPCPHPYN